MSQGLIEILPPAPPPEAAPLWLAAPVVLALLAVALLGLRYYHAPRRRARRRLHRLRAAVQAGRIEGRVAAHALAALLGDGLGAMPADLAAPLAAARFAPAEPADLNALLAAAARHLEAAK
ncbi:MAG: hypothetical protein AB1450_07650 [Pseudomonadota bacterium]